MKYVHVVEYNARTRGIYSTRTKALRAAEKLMYNRCGHFFIQSSNKMVGFLKGGGRSLILNIGARKINPERPH